MALQYRLKKRVTPLQCLKVFVFHLVALLFFSVCTECPGRNIDILIFPLSLKTVTVPVGSFSFIALSLAIYTQIVMSSGKHAYRGLSLRAVTCSTRYS